MLIIHINSYIYTHTYKLIHINSYIYTHTYTHIYRRFDDLKLMLFRGDVQTQQLYQTWADVAGIEATSVDEATAFKVYT